MKLLKYLAAGALLAASLGQSAWATTGQLHIYITGSTAYRNAALPAIASALGITAGSTPPLLASGGTANDTTYTGSVGTSNTTFIWEGGHIGATAVTVCATFTGSESGVQTVTGSIAIPFMNDSNAASNPSVVGSTTNPSAYTNVQGTAAFANYTATVPDIAFTDVYQSTTPFNNTFLGHPYVAANDNIVGICTFKWMASTGFPLGTGSFTGTPGSGTTISSYSIEPNFVQRLFSSGIAPLSQMTGNAAHQQIEIVATGRNPDSGTRATALADSGYGVNTLVQQYYPSSVTGSTVNSLDLFPGDTIAGVVVADGNNGQASGANLRGYLQLTIPASLGGNAPTTSAMYFLTYLGTADAGKVEGGSTGAVELPYKGTVFSLNAVYQGQYSFWSYEHVIDIGVQGNATKQSFESTLVSTIQNFTTGGSQLNGIGISIKDPAILLSSGGTGLARGGDGKPVTLGYTF